MKTAVQIGQYKSSALYSRAGFDTFQPIRDCVIPSLGREQAVCKPNNNFGFIAYTEILAVNIKEIIG